MLFAEGRAEADEEPHDEFGTCLWRYGEDDAAVDRLREGCVLQNGVRDAEDDDDGEVDEDAEAKVFVPGAGVALECVVEEAAAMVDAGDDGPKRHPRAHDAREVSKEMLARGDVLRAL